MFCRLPLTVANDQWGIIRGVLTQYNKCCVNLVCLIVGVKIQGLQSFAEGLERVLLDKLKFTVNKP